MRLWTKWIADYVALPPELDIRTIAHDLTMTTVEVERIDEHPDGSSVLEIDNKSLTNRPDLWGHHGIARELAAIYNVELLELPAFEASKFPSSELIGHVDPTVCGRFVLLHVAAAAEVVTPAWIRSRLDRIGQRSINLWTDLSNFVMYSVGQPLHAYDARQLAYPIRVERNHEGIVVQLLNGGSHRVQPGTPLVSDGVRPAAVAGVMGTMATAVQSNSQEIVFEVANFDPTVVRRSSQQLDLRTEASTRFEKGIDTQRVDLALGMLLNLLEGLTSASVLGVHDVRHAETKPKPIELDLVFLARRIGRRLPPVDVIRRLTKLGFQVGAKDETLLVTVPTWRSTGDISLPQDLVEEVARLWGYESFPATAPVVELASPRPQPRLSLERRLREQIATRGGFQEVVTYPWVGDDFLAAVGIPKEQTVTFAGAPSPDRSSLRPSLLPNLLEAVVANLRYQPVLSLFEVGTVFSLGEPGTNEGHPDVKEARHLAGALVGSDSEELFFRTKGLLEAATRLAHVQNLEFTVGSEEPWCVGSAQLSIVATGERIGSIGVLADDVAALVGMTNASAACFELDIDRLAVFPSRENRYLPLSEFPEVRFDLSVLLGVDVPWAQLAATVSEMDPLIRGVTYLSDFRGMGVGAHQKSVTFRVRLLAYDRTITGYEIAALRELILASLQDKFGATLRA